MADDKILKNNAVSAPDDLDLMLGDLAGELSGEVMIALPGGGDTLHSIGPDSIVLCGNQPEVVDLALEKKARCVILCQNALGEKYRGISSKTCVISFPRSPHPI